MPGFFNVKYGIFFRPFRRGFKFLLNLLYPVYIKIWNLPKVQSREETLLKIKEENKSIVRFGDGEILFIAKKWSLPFQEYNTELAIRLKEILASDEGNILIALPGAYRTIDNLRQESKIFWKSQIVYNYHFVKKYLNIEKVYYNANITRLYYSYSNHQRSGYLFDLIRSIWDNREILLIEGEKSRLGIGNDLFCNANSVKRILGPSQHAFRQFSNLLNEAKKHAKEKLVLVAMGPTAKVLVYDLATLGHQAVDIGNLDLEYEWFKREAKERILIPGKYVSEVVGGREVADIDDPLYESQIIAKFL